MHFIERLRHDHADTGHRSSRRRDARRTGRRRTPQGLAAATLGAIGVVYGDIGTSPLYTVKEVFAPAHRRGARCTRNLIGAVSCIFWALMLVVTLKYVMLILRADNRGEGGVLALTALAAQAVRRPAAAAPCCCCSGRARRHAVLRRQRHHAGDLGARRDGGPARSSRRRSSPTWCRRRWSILVGLFARAALRHRHGRPVVRPGDPAVVRDARRRPASWHIAQQPAILAALDPRQACAFLAERGWQLFAGHRRHRAGAHRRRGAVRRHGPLRPQADPARLDTAWCCRRWRSTTWARARC